MAKTTIRQLTDHQEILEAFNLLSSYAFRPSPPVISTEDNLKTIEERKNVVYFALYEDGQSVSTVAATPMAQNVRGKLFPMSGIFDVITHPAARRKGYSRQTMQAILKAEREAGKIVTCLYPFRESFYERMGYVSFPQPMVLKFNTADLAPLLKKDLPGKVEFGLATENFEAYLDYMHACRERTHGLGMFDHPTPPPPGRDSWIAQAKVDGQTVGVMVYRITGEQVTKFRFFAPRFYTHKVEGRYLLLNWIARHIDQASHAEIWLPAYETPNLWFPDMNAEFERAWIPGMGRVLDIEQINGLQTGPGGFSARVSDPLCPWNEGIWQFETVDGFLQVSPAAKADCDLSIQGLSALVYGTHAPEVFTIRGWGEVPEQIQGHMRTLFPAKEPHLHEMF